MEGTQLETSKEGTGVSQEGLAGGPGEDDAGRTQMKGTPPTPLGTPVRVENLAARVPETFAAPISNMMTKAYFETEQEANMVDNALTNTHKSAKECKQMDFNKNTRQAGQNNRERWNGVWKHCEKILTHSSSRDKPDSGSACSEDTHRVAPRDR